MDAGHRAPHVGALNTLHNQIRAIAAHFLYRRYGVSLRSDVLHGPSLFDQDARPRSSKYQSRAVLEDVSVPTGGQQGPWLLHPTKCYVRMGIQSRLGVDVSGIPRCRSWAVT